MLMGTMGAGQPRTIIPFPASVRNREEEVIARFLEGCRSERTRNAYQHDLAAFGRYHNGQLAQVGRSTVEGYILSLKAKGYAPSTISRMVASVRSLFNFMVDERIVDRNPAQRARLPRVSQQSSTLGLSRDEARRLLLAVGDGKSGLRDRSLLSMLLMNALRVSEALSADVERLQDDGGYRVLVVDGKGGTEHRVPLPPAVFEATNRWLHAAEIMTGPIFRAVTKGGVVSASRLSKRGAFERVRTLAKRAGIEKQISPHSLRHTAITLALDSGMSLRDAQDFARHADPRTTRRYDRNREALNNPCPHALAAILDG